MAGTVADVVRIAVAEWDRWGNAVEDRIAGTVRVPHDDKEKDASGHLAFAQLVRDTYCKAGVGDDVSVADIATDQYAWSAAFISWVMKQAGVPYRFNNNHSVYFRHYIKARADADQGEPYWGFKRSERTPAVGDLVGYVREPGVTFGDAEAFFAATTRYKSHSDIVVATAPGRIEVIGGNVKNAVVKKTLAVDADGRLVDRGNAWFVVLGARFA